MVKKRDDFCRKVALIHGVSPRYVTMVRNGERNNEAILASLMDLVEGEKELLDKVKQLAEQDKANAQKCKPCNGGLFN